ncbi:hypothetical protein [Lentisalinibacter sediminis]|uniref:hypothetical protein n=1 Tax=Lentisalinibacter sediminis TaxID=2992237 RepID=UPI003869BAF6
MRSLTAATIVSLLLMSAAQGASSSDATESLRVVDWTPRFLAFYETAKHLDKDADRFAVWKDMYDFVALPPGLSDRDKLAQRMLASSWPRYGEAIERIRRGPEGLEPESILDEVSALVNVPGEIPPIDLLYFVGMFEGNGFFAPQSSGSLLVAVPVEVPAVDLQVTLAHELFHAVHHSLRDQGAGLDGNVASLILSEGLAMWASRELFPGRPMSVYTSGRSGWSKTCRSRLDQILDGLKPNLTYDDPEFLNDLTVGSGTTGLNREAYCAAWHLVGALLAEGYSFGGMARAELPHELIEHAIFLWHVKDNSAVH